MMLQMIVTDPGLKEMWGVVKGRCYLVRKQTPGWYYILAKRRFKSNSKTKKDLIRIKESECIVWETTDTDQHNNKYNECYHTDDEPQLSYAGFNDISKIVQTCEKHPSHNANDCPECFPF